VVAITIPLFSDSLGGPTNLTDHYNLGRIIAWPRPRPILLDFPWLHPV
jgi:hypothetical protein